MTPPSVIAHYRITAKLGEGGMGAVYRATDTKLNRDVAVKVLPDSFALDPDRLARFTREAQVVASLNHPNIAAIYGVEERALILELVDGLTLAERIAQGPIPVDEALPIARQIAEALEYAHERGIVHRDLKPANVKITPEGRVKVLDFGLAKALASETLAGDPMSSPTLTMRATLAGVIMGTAGYMAPEQAKGKPVDRRVDIWSFGIVLAEMLTGRAMYSGETVSEILAAVIMKQPEIPGSVPPHIQALLRRCLERDPQLRLQAIGEARIAIDRPFAEPAASAPPAAAPARRGAPWWTLAAAALIPTLVLAAFLWRATRPVEHPLQRFSVDLGPNAVSAPRLTAAISPDGTRIVFPIRAPGGEVMLATRTLDQSSSTPLPGTESAFDPFFSPDGQWIGFSSEGRIRKVSVHGGAVVNLTDTLGSRGADWSSDGNIYISIDGANLFRLSASGGKPQPLVSSVPPGGAEHRCRWPQVLPPGDRLLLTCSGAGAAISYEDADIELLSLKTGRFQSVLHGGYFARYLPTGHLVYLHQGSLFAVPFDIGTLQVRGTPVPVLDEIDGNFISGGGQLAFSSTGTLVFLSGKYVLSTPTPAVWLTAAGEKSSIWSAPSAATSPRLSPDGSRLAVSMNGDISVYDFARRTVLRLSFNPGGNNGYPAWAPDGKHIAYSAVGDNGIWWVRADGSGQPQLLYSNKGSSAVLGSISSDGRYLAYHSAGTGTGRDIWTLPLDLTDPEHPKAAQPELFLATPTHDVEPVFSPDGHWLAYSSSESGASQVYVRPFPAQRDGGKWQISTAPGRFPIWSRNGKELFYMTVGGNFRIMSVPYTATAATFSPDAPRQWSETQIAANGNFSPFDLAPGTASASSPSSPPKPPARPARSTSTSPSSSTSSTS